MGPLLNQQTSFHSNLLFRMGRLIEMELLKSLAAASQTAIQEELRIVWWVVDCLLWLVCLRGYGPWPAMALRERKTNKKSNQQSKEREWTNQLLLERPFSKEWMKWMSWWKKRKGVVFVNGAPRADSPRQVKGNQSQLFSLPLREEKSGLIDCLFCLSINEWSEIDWVDGRLHWKLKFSYSAVNGYVFFAPINLISLSFIDWLSLSFVFLE